MRKRIWYLLPTVVGVVLVACLFMPTVMWVGWTDLTVEFVVTDVETGAPIEGAEIVILSGGGLNEDGRRLEETDRDTEEFALPTNVDGKAEYVCRHSMCFGTSRPLRFTDTYCVHLPRWYVTPKASGYCEVEPFFLDVLRYQQAAKRVGNKQSKLVVPIALHKLP